MIFIYNYFQASKLPKFLDNTAEMMQKTKNKLFFSVDDMRILQALLTKRLNEDRPKGSTAYADFFFSGDSGGVYVYLANDSQYAVLRCNFITVDGVLRSDEKAGDFFECDFIEKGGAR